MYRRLWPHLSVTCKPNYISWHFEEAFKHIQIYRHLHTVKSNESASPGWVFTGTKIRTLFNGFTKRRCTCFTHWSSLKHRRHNKYRVNARFSCRCLFRWKPRYLWWNKFKIVNHWYGMDVWRSIRSEKRYFKLTRLKIKWWKPRRTTIK